jgi:uncharacterized membrane protein YbhN (UPF0104 family)
MATEVRQSPVRSQERAAAPGASRAIVRRVLIVVVVSAALATLILAVPSLGGVRHDLGRIDLEWIAVAIALELASCISFVIVFRAFFDEVPGPLTRRIAWVEIGSGALLPGGGVTSYVLGGLLLRQAGMSRQRIIKRSGGVFWLTTFVNAVAAILGAVLLLVGVGGHHDDFTRAILPLVVVVPLTVIVAGAPWLSRRLRPEHRIGLVLGGIDDGWRAARHPSWRLVGALGYLGFDIAVLGCLLRAVGCDIDVPSLVLAYLLGYLATAIPVPGGFGVLEGGLLATLVAYGASAPEAGAAVLVYHAIAFWIPSLGGLGAYAVLHAGRPAQATSGETPPPPESATASRPSRCATRSPGAGAGHGRAPARRARHAERGSRLRS